MKTTNVLLVVIILGIIVIGLVVWKKPATVQTPSSQQAVSQMPEQNAHAPAANPSQASVFTGVDPDGITIHGNGPIPQTIAQAQVFRMNISNYAYVNASTGKPLAGYVPPMTEVVWTNMDSVPHTVTFDDGSVDSGMIAPGKSFAYFFTKAGTYAYHCTVHPMMKGTIVFKS